MYWFAGPGHHAFSLISVKPRLRHGGLRLGCVPVLAVSRTPARLPAGSDWLSIRFLRRMAATLLSSALRPHCRGDQVTQQGKVSR